MKVNEVYEVTTEDKQNLIVRISRSKHPSFEAEEKTIRFVLNIGVPTPKILLIEKLKQDSGNLTFCIEEKIDGEPLNKAVSSLSRYALESVIFEAGEILSKIHNVRLNGFGELYLSKPYQSWSDYILRPNRNLGRLTEAAKAIKIDTGLVSKAVEILKKHKNLYQYIHPYLLHGDFNAKNFLIKNNHIAGIIDFENAIGGDPAFDFSWFNWLNDFYSIAIPIQWLINGYKNKELFDNNFQIKMKLYRLRLGLGFIDYYEYEKNESGINYAKQAFLKELKNF